MRRTRQKKREKNREKRNTKGTTLVELIVSMGLIILFAMCTTMVLSQGYKVYLRIRGLGEAVQLTDLLLDRVEGELEGATQGEIKVWPDKIAFHNANGSSMFITTIDKNGHNRLLVNYDPVKIKKDDSADETTLYENMRWMFDESVYMDLEVEELTFQCHLDGYPENILKVSVQVSGVGEGFRSERYIRCYNFPTENAFGIVEKNREIP